MLLAGVPGKGLFGVTEEPAGGSAQPTMTPPCARSGFADTLVGEVWPEQWPTLFRLLH